MASRSSGSWRAVKETGPVDSGVFAYPDLATRPQPAAGQNTSGDREQRLSSSSSSSSSSPSPVQTPAFRVSSYYPDPGVAMLQPQAWQWYYYDPTRLHLLPPSQPPSSSIAMPGPPLPSVSTPSGIASPVTPNTIYPIEATLEPIDASLKALHSKFTTFQQDLGGLKSDVKDALSQIQSLRTAQNKTNKSITELHDGLSATRARSRGRGKGGRGRARGSNAAITPESPPDVEDVDVGPVLGKTLAQSMASIQSAIEALLSTSHSHPPAIHWETNSPPTFPPVVNHLPVQQALQALDSPPRTASTQPAPPEQGYADASTQTCVPSSPSERSSCPSSSRGFVPGLIPVDWNIDPATPGRFASNSIRPTAQSAESLGHVSHSIGAPHAVTDAQTMRQPLCNLAGSEYHSPTRPTSSLTLSSRQSESVVTNTTQQAQSILPTASSTSDSSVEIPVRPLVTKSSSRMLDQSPVLRTPFPTSAGVKLSNKSSQMEPSVDPQVLLRSPSSSLSSTCDTPMDVGFPGNMHAKSAIEDAQVTSDTVGDAISVASALKTAAEFTPIASEHCHQSSPIAADDEGLTSGLPTPPSETVLDERESRVVSRTARGDNVAIDLGRILHAQLSGNPTPSFLTTELSMGQDRGDVPSTGDGSSLGEFSKLPSPLTPSLLPRSPAVGFPFVEEGTRNENGQTATYKVVEEHTNSPNDTRVAVVDTDDATKRVNADAPMDEAGSSAGTEQMGGASMFAMPVTTPTNESQSLATSDGDVEPSKVPKSSTPPNVALPEGDPTVDPAFSPSINDTGYDFHFSSPLRRPSPPMTSTPSRYATPSEPSDSHLTQDHDEDEVWHALILNGSGVSTPLSSSMSLPMHFSHQPSRASSVHLHPLSVQPLSVDPSVLQLHAPEHRVANSHPVSDRSLSPLSSLSDTDVEGKGKDDDADTDVVRTSKTPRVRAPPATAKSRGRNRGRRSEPHPTQSRLSSSMPGEYLSVARAASEADVSTSHSLAARAGSARSVGGPGASVEELTLLARRQSLKICLKVPEGLKWLKRKRDDADGEGEGADVVPVKEDVNDEYSRFVGEDANIGRRDGVSPGVPPPSRIGTTSMPVTHSPTPTASRLRESTIGQLLAVDDVKHPDMPVPRKRKKRQTERDGEIHATRTVYDMPEDSQSSHVGAMTPAPGMLMPQLAPECSTNSVIGDGAGSHFAEMADLSTSRKKTKKHSGRRQKNHQQEPRANPNSPVKCHVRNGQITAGSPTRVHATSSTLVPVEVNQEARTPTRTPRTRQANRAANMETSSLENPSQPSLRDARLPPSSPVKEDAWDSISPDHGTWPELPNVFSNWDVQFIQCDNCDKWYHYGCVSIESGDPRLEPGVLFICPTCHNQSARRQTLRHQGDTCARPDCAAPKVISDTDVFVIEKLVGRKKCEGYIYMWLAKWEGYPISQATWIPKENVVGDSTKMINTFLKDAIEEGVNHSQDVMLLQEAIEGGWEA